MFIIQTICFSSLSRRSSRIRKQLKQNESDKSKAESGILLNLDALAIGKC